MENQLPSTKNLKELKLPISRVKTIMKSSPQVENIGQDCLFLVTKATEMFIQYLAQEAHNSSEKNHCLEYKHLAEVVQTNDTLEFLREIMPRKITVRYFKQMMAAREAESSSDSDSDSQSDSESNSDSDKPNMENGNSSASSSSEEASTSKRNCKDDESTDNNSESDADET